jgi:putative chitinase
MANEYTPQEIQALLDEYASSFDSVTGQLKVSEAQFARLSRELGEAVDGLDTYTKTMNAAMGKLGTSMKGLGTSLAEGKSGASVFNDSIGSTAKMIDTFASQFGIFGRILGAVVTAAAKYVEAVNKQADGLFDSYQQLSRSGLASGMQDTFKNLQDMGYTMAEIGNMSGILKENAAALSNFGGTATQGAQRFAAAARGIQESGIGIQFKRMGMSVDDINTGIASYVKIQQISGSTAKLTNEQLMTSAAAYIEQQDKLTKITGASAQEQEQIIAQAMSQQQYAITQYRLQKAKDAGDLEASKKWQRNNDLVIEMTKKYGAQTAAGLTSFLSGSMRTPQAQAFQRTFPELASQIRKGVTDTGELMNTSVTDSAKALDRFGGLAVQDAANGIITSTSELINGQGNIVSDQVQAQKDAKKQQDDQKKGADEQVALEVRLRNSLRLTTQGSDRFVNAGITPTLTGMALLASAAESAAEKLDLISGKKSGSGLGFGPSAATAKLPVGTDELIKKMSASGITDKMAQSNILAQIAAESGGVAKTENLNYSPEQLLKMFPKQVTSLGQAQQVVSQGPEAVGNLVYGGRMGNAGDEGFKYRGRGLIQLTGKDNYAHFGSLLGVDLVNNPDLANDPKIAQQIAIAFYKEKEKGTGKNKGINLSSISDVNAATGFQDIGGEESRRRADMARQYRTLLGSDNVEELTQEIPMMGTGGITNGLTLAGEVPGQREAVVPLPDGRSIPVQIMGGMPGENQLTTIHSQMQNLVNAVIKSPDFGRMPQPAFSESAARESQPAQPQYVNQNGQEQTALLSIQIDKLDTLIRTMSSQTDISRKILQRQS